MSMSSYFDNQAQVLISQVKNDEVGIKDVALALETMYAAGIIDSSLYSEEQKKKMYNTIKLLYPEIPAEKPN